MDKFDKNADDFWNLDQFVPKRKRSPDQAKQFSRESTSAVEIDLDTALADAQKAVEDILPEIDALTASARKIASELGLDHGAPTPQKSEAFSDSRFSDSRFSTRKSSPTSAPSQGEDGVITRFIPPHSDASYVKKHVLAEYQPENPLIKSVRIISDKPDETLFVENNLFIRERRALLHRKAAECAPVSYYSYSPRYSQMSRAQLNWYLWWRENTRNGIFLKTDESYIILYAYELCSAGKDEDKHASLDMLCALLENYTEKELSVILRMMLRDTISDFCLLHALPSPLAKLERSCSRSLLTNAPIPEFFLDFSKDSLASTLKLGLASLSMYDFRRSKYYTDDTKALFERAMNLAISAIFEDKASFQAITAFTSGVYGCITSERRPFGRMINIVNRNVRLEITYFQMAQMQAFLTGAIRYSENKLRDHLGIKSKLQIMAINPAMKDALDRFFMENYPAQPTIDRRRRAVAERTSETHEYDALYDVPKAEISLEKADEIERDSWSTTKILTEAFGGEAEESLVSFDPLPIEESVPVPTPKEKTNEEILTPIQQIPIPEPISCSQGESLMDKLRAVLGSLADFLSLCESLSPAEQRKFATSHALSLDELADRINECAVDIFGDILLEEDCGAYRIIEDYKNQFDF